MNVKLYRMYRMYGVINIWSRIPVHILLYSEEFAVILVPGQPMNDEINNILY